MSAYLEREHFTVSQEDRYFTLEGLSKMIGQEANQWRHAALAKAGAAGLAWMEGTPADWTGERLLAAGEVLYGDGRMVNRCERRYLKEHAPLLALEVTP